MDKTKLPREVFSGFIRSGAHVQGIATDGEYMYYSFTTMLVKTDMSGKLIGTVDGLTGHLGCIAYNESDRAVYGSLEYKNDGIGRGILATLGKAEQNPDAFYIARFDTSRITEIGMSAHEGGVMTLVKLADVCEDYAYSDGKTKHRHGCSGIDGITVVPDFEGKRTVMVAYGIYQDVSRDDNDDQVLLAFTLDSLVPHFSQITSDDMYRNESKGIRADRKLFVHTGNTAFGVQNLEYDPTTECILAAVYRGTKPQYPNRAMYFIDMSKPVCTQDGREYLTLAKRGVPHESGIWGSDFPLGSTGMISLGGGYYYFSEAGSTSAHENFSRVKMYRLDDSGDFAPV